MTKKISVDYLTLRFTERFTVDDFNDYINEQQVSEHGEILPPRLLAHQFRVIQPAPKTWVVSLYSGGEQVGIDLERRYGLPVTRLDLCLDMPFEDGESAEDFFNDVVEKVDDWRGKQPFSVSRHLFDGKAHARNGEYGAVWFSRASEKQLRVYQKRLEDNFDQQGTDVIEQPNHIRLEWQLRKELAREVYAMIIKDYPLDRVKVWDVYQSIYHRTFGGDLLSLGGFTALDITMPVKPSNDMAYEKWLLVDVPKSMFRKFQATGIDYSERLVTEFQRLVTLAGLKADRAIDLRQRRGIAAQYQEVGRKIRQSLPPTQAEPDDTVYCDDCGSTSDYDHGGYYPLCTSCAFKRQIEVKELALNTEIEDIEE